MRLGTNNRRHFLKHTAAGLSMFLLPGLSDARDDKGRGSKKIVCVGGHPDDPESGCGGTLAQLEQAGHSVTIIYLTTGEAGIEGKHYKEAGSIRKQESVNACRILRAKPVFAGQTDGNTIVNNESVERMSKLLAAEKPDLLFTHWPIDSHRDHQAASILAMQAWMRAGSSCPVYFFEVSAGIQTVGFNPTDYVDITHTQKQKRDAVFCHVSQKPESIYTDAHAAMEDFRGREIGVKAAEAFVRMNGKSAITW